MNDTIKQAYVDKLHARLEEWGAVFNAVKAKAELACSKIAHLTQSATATNAPDRIEDSKHV